MTEALLERATILYNQKRYKEAEKTIAEILALDPQNVLCILMLTEIRVSESKYEDAFKLIDSAIALNPENDSLFYTKARIYYYQGNIKEALNFCGQAIELDPYDADNFALKGLLLNSKLDFKEGLKAANNALEIDSTHILALNVRSTAQLKLNDKEGSFETIKEALNENPNNAYTHANYGWGLLEKGETKMALNHFSEALKNDPNSSNAQAGMTEALKSKYLLYRWFLKYVFWMNNMVGKHRWYFIIGFYVLQRGLRAIATYVVFLEPFLFPIIIVMAVFAMSTWLINPITNLFFRFNKYGKHLLSKSEIMCTNFIVLCLLIFFIGIGMLIFTENETTSFQFLVFGFTMMLPVSKMFDAPKKIFISYTIGLFLVGLASISMAHFNNNPASIFTIIYIGSIFIFQFVANYFSINKNHQY